MPTFVKSIRLLTFVPLLALLSLTAEAKTYKIATVSPDGLGWMKEMRAGVKEINQRTEGRVKFKIYPGGVQGDDATVLRKMRIGQLQGGMMASSSLTRFYPDLQIYSLPLQFRNQGEVDFVRKDMDQTIINGLEQNGIKSFHLAETGFAYLLSQTPVQSLEELQKLKIWVPDGDPIAARLIKGFGISPIPLNLTDVLAGLQTGLIDAVAVPPIVALALQWHNHVSYVTDLPLMYTYSMLVLDQKVYNKMSAEDQKIVSEVMDRIFARVDKDNSVDNIKAYDALVTQGIKKVEPDLSQLDSWRAQATEIIADLVKSGEISQQSVDALTERLAAVRANTTAGQ